jgi:hypothetical protein
MRIRKITALSVAGIALFFVHLERADGQTFPSSNDPIPAGWTGPVFKLRQDYPKAKPAAGLKPWKSFDFKRQPAKYIQSVLDYRKEGNVEVDWQLEKNTVRK